MNQSREIQPQTNHFLQINDLHVIAPGFKGRGNGYKGANKRATWLLNAIAQKQEIPELDLVLGVGDLVHGETLEGIEKDLKWFQAANQNISYPFYPLMGNHEVSQNQGVSEWESPFLNTFGAETNNYTLSYGDLLIIMFNNSGTGHMSSEHSAKQFEWLRSTLEKNPSRPKMIACHVPLIPIREKSVLAESFGFQSYYTLEPDILELVEQHASSILAVLSGHLHMTGTIIQNGIHHICISGTASYPSDYALYTLLENGIEVSIRQVPSHLLDTWETDIHGKRRHGKDFTDQTHDTPETYLMGNPEERHFIIPFKH
ncbi:MAG: metallophosphoesterase [Opitutaceae bacterium]|nr:metallophosphoesterase [Opitutaceae bacterium]